MQLLKIRKTSPKGVWAVDALLMDRAGRTQWVPFAWQSRWSKAVEVAHAHVKACVACKGGAGGHWELPDGS
jgi:hypothetical protein